MTLAAGTAWARVEAQKHFPSDILAGAALGNFVASFVHDAFLGLPDDRRLALAVTPSRGRVVIAVAFDF
jgi:membrane-associated phospholipid phosphatase